MPRTWAGGGGTPGRPPGAAPPGPPTPPRRSAPAAAAFGCRTRPRRCRRGGPAFVLGSSGAARGRGDRGGQRVTSPAPAPPPAPGGAPGGWAGWRRGPPPPARSARPCLARRALPSPLARRVGGTWDLGSGVSPTVCDTGCRSSGGVVVVVVVEPRPTWTVDQRGQWNQLRAATADSGRGSTSTSNTSVISWLLLSKWSQGAGGEGSDLQSELKALTLRHRRRRCCCCCAASATTDPGGFRGRACLTQLGGWSSGGSCRRPGLKALRRPRRCCCCAASATTETPPTLPLQLVRLPRRRPQVPVRAAPVLLLLLLLEALGPLQDRHLPLEFLPSPPKRDRRRVFLGLRAHV